MDNDEDLGLDTPVLKALKNHLSRELAANYSDQISKKGRRIDKNQILEFGFVGDEVSASVSEKRGTRKVRMILPLFEDNGYSFTSCDCNESLAYMDEQHCHHMWAVQNELLRQTDLKLKSLTDQSHTWEKVHTALLACLDDCVESANTSDLHPKRIQWQIKRDLSCQASLQRHDGFSWKVEKRIKPNEYAFEKTFWSSEDDKKIAAQIGTLLHKEHESSTLSSFGLLNELSQLSERKQSGKSIRERTALSPVIVNEACEKIDIIHGDFTIVIAISAQRISLRYQIGGVGASISKFFSEGMAIFLEDQSKLYLSEFSCGGGDSLKLLYENLKEPFSIEDFKKFAPALSAIQRHYPILVEYESLQNEAITDQALSYLRMTPTQPQGVCLEMNIKPLSMFDQYACYLKPGIGPQTIYGLQSLNKIYYQQRNKSKEQETASVLIECLQLKDAKLLNPYVWQIMGDVEALEFLDRLSQSRLKDSVIIEWPKDELNPYQVLEPSEDEAIDIVILEKNDWFQLAGELKLGSSRIDLLKLMSAFYQNKKFVKLAAGQWLKITESLRQRLEQIAGVSEYGQKNQAPYLKVSPHHTEKWIHLREKDSFTMTSVPESWSTTQERLRTFESHGIAPSDHLNASLRPYQLKGFQWLMGLYQAGVGGILADDMGLGKTLQTIALLQIQSKQGPSLVLCPSSVVANWLAEISRFAPDLKGIDYRSCRKDRDFQGFRAGQIVVSSYGLLLQDSEILSDDHWNILVCDEAQNCKNPESQTFKSAKGLCARLKLALSGTPIENNLRDLWALFALVSPSLLGPWSHFKETWAIPIEQNDDLEKRAELKLRIQNFILRRLKSDFLTELPPKTESVMSVFLSKNERELYHRYRLEAVALLTSQDSEENDEKRDHHGEGKKQNKKRLEILSYLGKLRQICSLPSMVEADWTGQSSKEEAFQSLALKLVAGKHRTLVFSQFPRFLKRLNHYCQDAGYKCLYLDGATKVSDRSALVSQFQKGTEDFFFISLKAGGTGINLTSANCIVHLDPWWNPAIESQATDRAHRMGQTEPTLVYRFICYGTIEEKMIQLHQRKKKLAGNILAEGDESLRLGGAEIKSLLDEAKLNDFPSCQ